MTRMTDMYDQPKRKGFEMQKVKNASRRTKFVTIALVLVAAIMATTAFAYFNSGNGSSSSGVAVATASNVNLDLTAATTQSGPLLPGDSATVTASIHNATGSSVHAGTLSAAISGVPVGCPVGSFTVSTPIAVNAAIAAGATAGPYTFTISFVDQPANDQAPCGGVSPLVTITLGA